MRDGPHGRRPVFGARFPLLESKLQPITPSAGSVARRRVLEALLAEPRAPVVAMIAPPGYGKTTVLAQWAALEPQPVTWLTVDDADNDPAVLLAYVAAAFDRLEPLDPSLAPAISVNRDRILAAGVPRLLTELYRWRRPATLIIDDVHRLVDRTSLDALAGLMDHLPVGFRVAIAGRHQPDLPFARLRASRSLLEVGIDRLALDEAEAAELIVAAGLMLGPDEIHDLVARTEGWAAGIYLATLPRGTGDASPVGERVTGRERYIAAYLRSEIGRDAADDDLAFMTRTSILETVEPAVAEVVTEQDGAATRLRRLAHDNLLVQEIGRSGAAYRYHNLLRDYLRAELLVREPSIEPELHRRAASWFWSTGNSDMAIRHALEGGDVDAATRYLTVIVVPMYQHGRLETLTRWLDRLAPSDFERQPKLALVAGWINLLAGRADGAERMADLVDGPAPGLDAASLGPQWPALRAFMARGGPRQVLADARQAVSMAQPGDGWRDTAVMALGAAYTMLGDLDSADRALSGVTTGADQGGQMTFAHALARRAGVRIRQGEWGAAETLIHESLDLVDHNRAEGMLIALLVLAVDARVAAQRGDFGRARKDLVRSQLVRPLASRAAPWFSVDALLELTRAYLAVSDPAGAQVALREAEAIVRRRPALGLLTTELVELRKRLASATTALAGASTLTAAELRVLPFLPTYLTFKEIADRLVISRNTVKSHALSIYGKLSASSRGEAVERAVELGLLEPHPGLGPARPGPNPDRAAVDARDEAQG